MTPSERARKLLAEATPGPWTSTPDGSLIECDQTWDLAEVFPAIGEIDPSTGYHPHDHEQKRKNAALIAAAPELLAALADELDEARADYDRERKVLYKQAVEASAERDALADEVERLREALKTAKRLVAVLVGDELHHPETSQAEVVADLYAALSTGAKT